MSCSRLLFVLFIFLFFTELSAQKAPFPYPVPEKSFISFADTGFHCAYLKVNDNKYSDFYFFVSGEKNSGILLSGENFINIPSLNFFLVNFRFGFLTMKYNVVPYIHPDFAIKFLYLLSKVKFLPRISDAMRTTDEQLKYKRRGWSNVEDSPHMLGLAADLSYFTRSDRNIIQNSISGLGVRFLEHGGRGNHHIHLQDETLWMTKKNSNTQAISDSLNRKLSENSNIMKPYAEYLYAENFTDGIEINFTSENHALIKVEFVTPLGYKQAELTAGIFEKGNHKFYIRPDFLKNGIYCVRVFKNGVYLEQKNFIKFEIKLSSP